MQAMNAKRCIGRQVAKWAAAHKRRQPSTVGHYRAMVSLLMPSRFVLQVSLQDRMWAGTARATCLEGELLRPL